jgi:hypothetical protein
MQHALDKSGGKQALLPGIQAVQRRMEFPVIAYLCHGF